MSFRKIQDHPAGFEQNKEKGFWSVVVPEETFNLFPDPSFEGANWQTPLSVSTGFATSTDQAFGKRAPTVQSGTTPTLTYTYLNTDSIFTPNKVYTWGLTLKATLGETFQVQVIWSNGNTVLATLNLTAGGFKERYSLPFTVPGGILTSESVKFVVKKLVTNGFTYWVDAYQLEQKAYPTSYCDGDQAGCQWLGEPQNSPSWRPANVPGGRVYEFKKDFNFAVMAAQGAGMPPMTHQTSDQPVRGGKAYIKTLPEERTIVIVGALEGRGEAEIEQKRDFMEQALTPKTGSNDDTTPPLLKLRHTVFNKLTQKSKEVEATVIYNGGLEGDNQSIYQDRIALQFTEFLPVGFVETSENYQAMNVRSTLSTSNTFLKRITGEWVALPRGVSPTSGVAVALAEDTNRALWVASGSGTLYVVDKIKTNPISGEKIVNTTNGSNFNAPIYALAPLPGNDIGVLVGGAYNFGGIKYIGWATGVGNTLSSVITLNAAVRAIWIDPITGKIWIGGDFTGAGTGGASNRLIILNPDFSVYATLNSTKAVYAIAPGPKAGQAYIGTIGGGGSINGTAYNAVALVSVGGTGPTVTVDDLGSLNAGNQIVGDIYTLEVGPDGTLYAGGKFGSIGTGPSVNAFSIAKFVSGHWQPIAGGLLNASFPNYWVNSIAFDKYGNLYAGGTFDQSFGSEVVLGSGYAMFDGSKWLPVEHIKQSGISTQKGLGQTIVTSDGRQVVSYESAANDFINFAGVNDILYSGSAPAYPKIKISLGVAGAARVYKIVNFSTKTEIYLNYSMTYQETLTLDFTPGNVDIVSNLFGSIKSKIVSSSKINSFRLQEGRNGAGQNRILLLCDSNLLTADIYWKNTYWGVDGGAR
jgi:hypothetical protein